MAVTKRRYEDGCAMAQGLDLVGERWALLVIRELIFGPKRFTDLRSDLPGIAATVLTQRLEDLEAAGILGRRILPPPGRVQVYELTPWGAGLEPAFRALGRWAAGNPGLLPGPMSAASVMLSMRTMFSPEAAWDFEGQIQMHLNRHTFTAEVRNGMLTVEPGPAAAPDATITTTPDTLAAILYGGHLLEVAMATEEALVVGDVAKLGRYMCFFPLPETR